MNQNVLLVAPPIYDFTAFDFWLKPYGLLNIAGRIDSERISFFDFLGPEGKKPEKDFGIGKFFKQKVDTPAPLKDIPRPYHRFGAPLRLFAEFLEANGPFDVALIGCGMTYWYPGVSEVIAAIRNNHANTTIVLGGIYPTLCPSHAASLGADLVVEGNDLDLLIKFLGLKKDYPTPRWDLCGTVSSGVMKITSGCPYSCSYCASNRIDKVFRTRAPGLVEKEYDALLGAGATDIAFYDDALLFNFENGLGRFLETVVKQGNNPRFHTPNGLHLRYITPEVAKKLVAANFKTFFLSLETTNKRWHDRSDRKADRAMFDAAVGNLLAAGAEPEGIDSYILMGHPAISPEMIEETLRFLESRKVRPRLSEFSPIPGTPDGDACSGKTDLAEPLNHNKLAWTLRFYGESCYQKIKETANSISKEIRSEDQ